MGEKKIVDESSKDKIDYKNLYSISNIEEGQILAEIVPGETGQDGKNVLGEILKRKTIKSRPIKVGEGCKIEGNNIIATKTGRPSSKNGILSVNNIYKIQDVDMKSGNINFIGDVQISGNVTENMKVKCGNSIIVEKNVDASTIIAGGEINIRGNAINSTILTGQIDMEKKMYLEQINEYKDNIVKLINAVEKLNESSNNSKKISELVKILIENRYKSIPKLSLGIITHNICKDNEKSQLVDFIRSKMMGLNITKINSLDDLNILKELIENEIDFLEDDMIIPADIYIGYCQDCMVKSTGSIIITRKGQYVSNLTALKDIIFLRDDAVARGGVLSARGNIKLGIVGSPAGVTTKLEVLPEGVITANIAYNSTIFCFGKRSKTLDVSGRKVKAYLNKEGEIIIEKFAL
ncbi:MAG: putative polymerase with PALM domain, HD hydrolase domain and Zn ribbon [Clostridium sp. Maddingley MBC34-26]|nr:MAG: putative polymerase with PALM domain, HD hydrolase domain and Zn ribbon [Clostridium sp. Maddingley MBC34-26]